MNVLLLSSISAEAFDFIQSNHTLIYKSENTSIISGDVDTTEVIITRSGPLLDQPFLESMPNLQAIIRSGVGIDNIDTNYLEKNSITLYQITDHHANAVSELAMGLFLDLARNITYYHNAMREGLWTKGSRVGIEISGKVIGIVGLGRIGMRLAELCRGWGIEILGVVDKFSNERRDKLKNVGIELLDSLFELAARADLIAVALPMTSSTKSLIGREFISHLKKMALLVNVGRGDIIDDDALADALINNKISGAALDVHRNEGGQSRFSNVKNVILTPHIGSSTIEAQRLIAQEVIKHIMLIEQNLKSNKSQ